MLLLQSAGELFWRKTNRNCPGISNERFISVNRPTLGVRKGAKYMPFKENSNKPRKIRYRWDDKGIENPTMIHFCAFIFRFAPISNTRTSNLLFAAFLPLKSAASLPAACSNLYHFSQINYPIEGKLLIRLLEFTGVRPQRGWKYLIN